MQAILKSASPVLPARPLGSTRSSLAVPAVQTKQAEASTSSRGATPSEEIYIGFKKDEGGLARAGRKGRVIKDDPRKYPTRDFIGVGGWAGGEAGLWKLREEVEKDLTKKQPSVIVKGPSSSIPNRAPAGKEVIYVGFNKDELDMKKAGVKGRLVVDDPTKYPSRDWVGVGGFAGGEPGIKQFVTTGTIKLRKPGEPGPRQFSPLTLAGVVALAGALGGLVLDLVSEAVPGEASGLRALLQVRLDDNTKLLLISSLGLVGTSALIVAINSTVRAVQEKLAAGAGRAVVTVAFGGVVLVLAKSILDS